MDWTVPARIKAKRAEKHIVELEAVVSAFENSRPYTTFTDKDPDKGDHLIRARIRRQPSLDWSAIIGDAIHNLRASLDVLVHQFVLASRCKPSDNLSFPVYRSRHDMETAGQTEIARCNETAMNAIKAAKPYKGGGNHLWLITMLDNADKHRLLIPAWGALRSIERDVTSSMGQYLPKTNLGTPRLKFIEPASDYLASVKDGTELYRVPAAKIGKVDMDPKFSFHVAFGEGKITKGEPLLKTLGEALHSVNGVIASLSMVSTGRTPRKAH